MPQMRVLVVGAGVSGLVTARVLEERGHEVQVIAAATGSATTSDVAGAVWLPYRAGPPERVAAWAATSRAWLEEIARTVPAAGVDLLAGYEITPTADPPWWADAVPIVRAAAPVTGAPLAWRFAAPRAEPARMLPWLAAQLRAPIERRTITDLAALADGSDADAVIDCAGLGARALAHDDALVPLLGQTVIAEPGGVDLGVTITDDRDPDDLFYVIPRRGELVLGGCALPVPPDAPPPAPDPAITARILAHAAALGLRPGATRAVRVGLRPFRPNVRLERDPRDARIVHNYGHGGAGFTLARGCALEVAQLLDAA
jgi:D-amino-acid oxidase